MNQPGIAGLTGGVVIPGLLIVFLALIILIFAVWVMGKVLSSLTARRAGKQASGQQKSDTASPVSHDVAANTSPPVANGISQETVAVISAAISAVMDETAPGVSYAITGIQRSRESRPVWGFAGMQQNTRPF